MSTEPANYLYLGDSTCGGFNIRKVDKVAAVKLLQRACITERKNSKPRAVVSTTKSKNWVPSKEMVDILTVDGLFNGYYKKIGRSDTAECSCGVGNENLEHIIRQCTKYNTERDELTEAQNYTANYFHGFNGWGHEE
ncbi:hypothetical protein FQA39_LY04100 [Lamprigera yunnana]|nr:hypothetical protein FQA39_LY04100 [Lamprigera yunnana]